MALSVFSPSRTVALITDEALCLYVTGIKGVRLVETVPWEAENFERNVASIISKDCGGKPVLILNDMVEISFRKERIPHVSPLDKNNVIQRKLNLAFPSFPVKAAMPLKEKIAKTDKTVASTVYIFSAVPASPALTKTIAAVSRSLAPVVGFGVLPIESSDMVKTLNGRGNKKLKTKSAWTIFIGQHSNGGLRQIVTKNGELALTRMTPVTDMNTDPEGWLRDVSQEFKATMSYLSRFGYAPDDGLSIYLIGNPDVGSALENAIGVPATFSALSVMQAAKILGVPLGRSAAGQNYADILHVAWVGRKSRLLLPMRAAAIEGIARPRRAAMFALIALLAGAAFLSYQALNAYQGVSAINEKIDAAQQQKAQLNVQYEKEVQRKEALGFDVKLVQASLRVYDNLEKHNVRLMKMFWGIGNALGRDLKIDKVSLVRQETIKKAPELLQDGAPIDNTVVAPADLKTPLFEAVLQMTFPSTTDVLKGNQEVREFRARIQELLPENTVEVTKFLKDYGYTNQLLVETGETKAAGVTQDFLAEIMIKGVAP